MSLLYRDGVVESDSLSYLTLTTDEGSVSQVLLQGDITCAGGVELEVTKYMDARGTGRGMEVRSTFYKYHAWRPGRTNESLLRYDCAHEKLHYHRFDPMGNKVLCEPLDWADMPRLDEVVREAVDLSREWDSAAPAGSGAPLL